MGLIYRDPELGRVFVPTYSLSLPSSPTILKEYGICVALQHRHGVLIDHKIAHNERVDQGSVRQDVAMFGAGTTNTFINIALASASITVAKTDLSLGTITASVTTNEFTTLGLARAAGSLSTYTAPSTLGGAFSRIITKLFTASGGATVYGSGLFDSATVSGSNIFCELLFGSTSILVSSDTLTVNWTVSN